MAYTALPMLALVVGAALALAAIGGRVSDVAGCSSSAYTRAVGRDVLSVRPGDALAGEADDCAAVRRRAPVGPAVRNLILSPRPLADAGAPYAAALGVPVASGPLGAAGARGGVLRASDGRLEVIVTVRDRYPPTWPRVGPVLLPSALGARSFVEVRVRRVGVSR